VPALGSAYRAFPLPNPESLGQSGEKGCPIHRASDKRGAAQWGLSFEHCLRENSCFPRAGRSTQDCEPVSRLDGVDEPSDSLLMSREGDIQATVIVKWVMIQFPVGLPHGAIVCSSSQTLAQAGLTFFSDRTFLRFASCLYDRMQQSLFFRFCRSRPVSTRFYCPDPPRDGRYRLRSDEARHLARVCRQVVGDRVELFDGHGFATIAQVVKIGKDHVDLVAEGLPIPEVAPPCPLTLATAIPKGDRFDWLVEKATEIGVARVIPLIAERSVVEPRTSKLERLRRTIVEASKQARRSRLMALADPISWPELVRSMRVEIRLIAQPEGLPPGRWPKLQKAVPIVLAVGPEGGFTPAEKALALEYDWHSIRLNTNILRVETAALAGSVAILTRSEEQDDDAMA
jgi:16S rRNA (uracil1498-N3)-methyltransferase